MTIMRANEPPAGIKFVRQGLDGFSVQTDAISNERRGQSFKRVWRMSPFSLSSRKRHVD